MGTSAKFPPRVIRRSVFRPTGRSLEAYPSLGLARAHVKPALPFDKERRRAHLDGFDGDPAVELAYIGLDKLADVPTHGVFRRIGEPVVDDLVIRRGSRFESGDVPLHFLTIP